MVVNAGDLLVPMRHHRSGKLQSLQSITPEGGKRFFPGGAASKAAFNIGRSQVTWYCEGYATGLSVRAALERLYRRDQVVICFSAHNLPVVAEPGGYVVADHGPLEVREPGVRTPLGRGRGQFLSGLRLGPAGGASGREVRQGHRAPLTGCRRNPATPTTTT